MDAETIRRILLNLVTMLLSLSVHEFSHAFVADRLGDDTPRRQGRLTLSPTAHYDIWGTFVIPIVGAWLGGFSFIGWARPVETVPSNYTRRVTMRTGSTLVAVAGPLSNFVLAVLAMAGLWIFIHFVPGAGERHDTAAAFVFLLRAMVIINVGLCVFNLIPLPPLDGARLLPSSLDDFQRAVAPYSFFIILIMLNVPVFRGLIFWPIAFLGGALQTIFGIDIGLGT